ncbi:hypothetical protein TBK1r_01780 [Stieleria magnilauensis]|uniref:Ribbon-helix-helix domain-containing protein n=2 Tax=Stieleria magnilauensis TaxID=2527963 RepID=A0ABX5XGZ1_9BACT|nr:hypothetical protein TBK1r_01780 [Planctomycetes bacterium TBK1r]
MEKRTLTIELPEPFWNVLDRLAAADYEQANVTGLTQHLLIDIVQQIQRLGDDDLDDITLDFAPEMIAAARAALGSDEEE